MGFLKGVRDLHKQGKEINKTFDPGQMMRDASAQMAQTSAMMAQQTQAATAAAGAGIEGTATVTAVRPTNGAINLQPIVQIDMTVMAEGRAPYPVTVEQVVPQVSLARVQPGASLRVKVDPSDPQAVWLDLA